MRSDLLDVPTSDELRDLSVVTRMGGEPWIRCVTAFARDGSEVTLSWDEVEHSVQLVWVWDGVERAVIGRDCANRVTVREEPRDLVFRVWTELPEISGIMTVVVGEHVVLHDSQLRAS